MKNSVGLAALNPDDNSWDHRSAAAAAAASTLQPMVFSLASTCAALEGIPELLVYPQLEQLDDCNAHTSGMVTAMQYMNMHAGVH